MAKHKVAHLVNLTAGGKKNVEQTRAFGDAVKQVQDLCRSLLIDYQRFYVNPTDPHTLDELFKFNPDTTTIQGGDTTLQYYIQEKEELEQRCTIAIIPAGTGDDGSEVLGLRSQSKDQAIRQAESRKAGVKAFATYMNAIVHGQTPPNVKPIDIMKATATFRGNNVRTFYTLNSVSLGISAASGLIHDTEGISYKRAFWKSYMKERPVFASIDIDGDSYDRYLLEMAATNGPFFGNGLPINPGAVGDDGVFNVTLIEPVNKSSKGGLIQRINGFIQLGNAFTQLGKGKDPRPNWLSRTTFEDHLIVELSEHNGLQLQTDGRYHGLAHKIVIEVLKGEIPFVYLN